MKFHQPSAEIFIPDGAPVEEALARTTHLCIAAHQDDVEIMAAEPILSCFQRRDQWFTAVIVTDGRGSPRDGIYAQTSDEDMRLIRFKEQRKAAVVGEYSALIFLDYPSKAIKDSTLEAPVADLLAILQATHPQQVYTHNLADKHDTHVAVALRTLSALRRLPVEQHPQRVLGCEVWRGLDWMEDNDKVVLDVSQHENLQYALLGVFDSQIAGGKRYDLATMGRRRANATYFESHGVDLSTGMSFAMDLTPLLQQPQLSPTELTLTLIQHFQEDVLKRLQRLGESPTPKGGDSRQH
ncbi:MULTISPECIES: PIG-L deacetylase family protein [Anaerolinea]|uniref:PIG-L deacetylase family protein n=1 Tax=Anaerolinea TaxID=233189 RepID=UPI00260462D1|nr:PIG-L family deacetylase [Anaerolinea thermophila]